MTQKTFNVEQSPFFVERNLETTRNDMTIQTRISNETWEDLQQYLMQKYETIDKVKSKFAYGLIVDFLNSIALDICCFRDSYVIMLFPKTTNLQELKEKSQIIGFLTSDEGFDTLDSFRVTSRNEYNFIAILKNFDEMAFEMLGLENLSKSALFNIDKEIQHDFLQVKAHLSELYKDIDVEDCYISIFNLNNYLDVLKEGQYVSRHSMSEHEGIIVLVYPDTSFVNICARIVWSYCENNLSLSFHVEDNDKFNKEIILMADELIIQEYKAISFDESRLDRLTSELKLVKKVYENKINLLEKAIEQEREREKNEF